MTVDSPALLVGRGRLAAALAAVQADLPHIAKDQTARVQTDKTSYSYSYADLAQVSKAILPLLGRHGLSWITRPTMTPDGSSFVLAYELLHTSGESVEGVYPLPKASTPQAMGSAITYARRYTLCSVTGVTPDSDDDDAATAQAEARPGGRPVQRRERAPREGGPSLEPGARPVARASRPAASGAPPLPGEDTGAAEGGGITDPQRRKMHAAFGEIGIAAADRDARLQFAAEVVGRPLKTSNELTQLEAAKVINRLEDIANEPPAAAGPAPAPEEGSS